MSKTIHILKGLRRNLTKRETVPAHGHHGEGMRTVPDGHEVADIELTVDLHEIARRLGVKAMANKTGRAGAMHGLIRARVTKRQREG